MHNLNPAALRLVALVAVGAFASPSQAQVPVPASTQFDVSGFIEEATLGPGASGLGVGPGAGAHQGGIIKVNGHVIIVPSETVVILPASAMTWQELFTNAPAPYTGNATGLAINDLPSPLTTYEASVIGNRVLADANHPTDSYIAALITVSQHALNGGAGFINFINYATGEMRVGGKVNVDAAGNPVNVLTAANPGTRVRINDPLVPAIGTGRYGMAHTPDVRFQVDQDNPTITAGTGFPMCLPRVDPAAALDPLCPMSQRPLAPIGLAAKFQTNDPRPICTDPPVNSVPAGCSATGFGPLAPPSAFIQVPMAVGDYITFSGTLVTDAPTPTTGPWPAAGTPATYVAAHTIVSNVAVYTWPGTNPAYIRTDVTLIGTGGLNVLGVGEATIRTRFEGMSTDASRSIHLYGIDVTPAGATVDRDWGTIGTDPGALGGGANQGRWRFRPPCLQFGSPVPAKPDKQCIFGPGNGFLPPPREMRAVIEGLQSQDPANPAALTAANGIYYGQYHAPISEYLFPENIPGNVVVENNVNALDFLAKGGYSSLPGTVAGVLSPWPSNNLPTAACSPPVANAGGPYSVAFNGSVLMSGSAAGTTPIAFAWTANAGSIAPTNAAAATFSAAGLAAGSAPSVTLTASNACGTSSATSTVTVSAALAPTVNPVGNVSVFSGAPGTVAVSGSDPNAPPLALTFAATQAGAPALTNLTTTSTGTASANLTFTAPILPANSVASTSVTLTTRATNTAGAVSNPVTSTVTVKPLPDAITITSAVYRLSQQRLAITATSSNANATLTVQPYITTAGVLFTPPVGTLTFTGANTFSITLVGAPEPACGHAGVTPPACATASLQVTSNVGGASPFTALTTVRQ